MLAAARRLFFRDLPRDLQHGAGERQTCHLVDGEPGNRIGVVSGCDVAAGKARDMDAEHELDTIGVVFGDNVEVDQMVDAGKRRAGFFHHLASNRIRKALALLDPASGKRVEPLGRCSAAPHQQKPAVMKDRGGNCAQRSICHVRSGLRLLVGENRIHFQNRFRFGLHAVSRAFRLRGEQVSRGLSILSNHLSLAWRVSTVAVAFAGLASCATLNEDQCRTANWQQLGQENGAAGHPASYIEEHRRACAEHKLPVDQQQWSIGWEQGIRVFCTPENGLTMGREGRSYANSCPLELKTDFEAAYSVSKALYDARASRDRIQRELDSLLDARQKAEKPEDRQRISGDIEIKRSSLRSAERRVWEAEGDYDLYVNSRGFTRR